MPVRVLPQTVINQIAAGEVVVNMASVAKELVENSIDAGSTTIRLELGGDLRDLVIADDGCGMGREDAELSLQRHATSKIRSADDLEDLRTRGFRGEALPSIASVSRLELITRPASDLSGTRIVVEGGAIERIESTGCPVGTRLSVRDLFYNTPARRKFLKSTVSELNTLMRTLVRQALAAPDVGFTLVRDGEVLLDLPRGQDAADRFLAICGGRVEHGLLAIDRDEEFASVGGHFARPMSTRADRRNQYLFVNGRPFSSKTIAASIEQAGRGFVMTGRFPIYCLFITVPPADVDFNVHPTKEEVRFRDERTVAGACYRAVREALEGAGHVPEMQLGEAEPTTGQPTQPLAPMPSAPAAADPDFFTSPAALVARAFERKRARELQTDWLDRAERSLPFQPSAPEYVPATQAAIETAHDALADRAVASPPPRGKPIAASPGERPEPEFWQRPYDPDVLGQVALRYIVARYGDDLLLIDQHAAHERLRFLELSARGPSGASQALLVPSLVEPGAGRAAAFRAILPRLAEMGFEIEPFGGSTWQVTAVPSELVRLDPARLLLDLLDDCEDDPAADTVDAVREKILIRAACHSSIRGGDALSIAEMRELLALMRRHRLSFTCPHGRPTIVRLGLEELDRQFKRTV